jgi:DNA modification methylase
MTVLTTTPIPDRDQPFVSWYQLPESYSLPLVHGYMDHYAVEPGQTILDPFAGAGTTLLAAKLRGVDALGLEVNPFLSWTAAIKTRFEYDLPALRADVDRLLAGAQRKLNAPLDGPLALPAMPRLARWITPAIAIKLLRLLGLIEQMAQPEHRMLARLAVAAILRPCSNMKLTPHAFGSREERLDAPVYDLFAVRLARMVADLEAANAPGHPPWGSVRVLNVDARVGPPAAPPPAPADFAITSPPYLNNLDYTMQTRLELFFLGFTENMDDLRGLRKRMMTSDAKAIYREIADREHVLHILEVLAVVAQLEERLGGRGWGWDYAFMAGQYFGGLLRVLQTVHRLLKPGGRFVLITGDSSHSSVLVPVPALTARLGEAAGFAVEDVTVLRTRRSSSHRAGLTEAAVVLRRGEGPAVGA